MPVQANICSLLVDLKREILVIRTDDSVKKDDLCDVVDARISQLVKQVIYTPYCNNFSFDIDKPAEFDVFDRAALFQMEQSDAVSTTI
jgi:hypothetical protein